MIRGEGGLGVAREYCEEVISADTGNFMVRQLRTTPSLENLFPIVRK